MSPMSLVRTLPTNDRFPAWVTWGLFLVALLQVIDPSWALASTMKTVRLMSIPCQSSSFRAMVFGAWACGENPPGYGAGRYGEGGFGQ